MGIVPGDLLPLGQTFPAGDLIALVKVLRILGGHLLGDLLTLVGVFLILGGHCEGPLSLP